MCAFAYAYTKHPWDSAGLICFTASAMLATPEMLTKSLLNRRGIKSARRVFELGLNAARFGVGLFVAVFGVLAWGWVDSDEWGGWFQSLQYSWFVLGCVIFVAYATLAALQITAEMADGLPGVDDELKKLLTKHLGPDALLILAAGFFLAGTVLQFVATTQ